MTPTASQWGPHLKGLDGVAGLNTVATGPVSDIRVRLREAVRDRSMMLVTGDPGCGKSFAVARAVEQLDPAKVTPVWLEIATTVRGKALALDLFPQITGVNAPPAALLRDLRTTIAEHLSEERRVLVLDEAQLVTVEAMQMLRWLHDRADAEFALVIVGTRALEKRLPPEVSSRVVSHVRLDRIADEDAPSLLADYHPLFAGADPTLVSQLNRVEARGEFRWWAKFLLRAHLYLPKLGGTLDADAADVICEQLRRGGRV